MNLLSPIEYMKSIKNPTEVKWMKHFGLLDSVAICEALMIVEQKIDAGEDRGRQSYGNTEYRGATVAVLKIPYLFRPLKEELYELDVAEQLKLSRADIAGDAYRGLN